MNDIEEILKKETYAGILYDMKCNIPAEIKDILLKKASLVKERIRSISNTFDLNKESRDATREIFGKLPRCLEILDNVRAKKLDRYGDVPHELVNILDPQLDIITHVILEINRVLARIPR
ncbi:MAG: hypothetical protein ACUBOA_14820 [Candidatus Loosdrechtia sp.]|uniref:hypothetical protein n=1 Tax=Candidatus Loosdrechtia sp. TaxID=3101272 RepID=UPI003A606ED9|nr:MAG: hypothetical protein QY305_12945 [Candidatus Jettenia sp. AMX2]